MNFKSTAPIFLTSFLIASFLFLLSGCEESGPDLNDPIAVAEYLCEKSNAVQEVGKDGDREKAMELLMEIQAFEREVRIHHGDGFGAFNSEMEREMNERCLLDIPR